MKRSAPVLALTAAALLLPFGCAEMPGFIFGATDLPVTTGAATLGVFPFDDTLDPSEGDLQVGTTTPALSYVSPGGVGRAVSVAGTVDVTNESDTGSSEYMEGRILEIPLGSDRLPGTVAVWVRVTHEQTDAWYDLASVRILEGSGYDLASVRILEGSGYVDSGQEEGSWGYRYSLSLGMPRTDDAAPGDHSVTVNTAGGYFSLEAVEPAEGRGELGYHLAVTYDAGGRVTLYVNGERRGATRSVWNRSRYAADLHLLLEADYSTVWSDSGDPGDPLSDYQQFETIEPYAAFDNLRIYRHALTGGEVAQIYEEELAEFRDDE
ncbi:MAG: LamG-like jellyroll fold domain-containing protein [Spirochaetaceae bacterium]